MRFIIINQQKSHYSIVLWIKIAFLILQHAGSPAEAQQCTRTHPQPNFDHSCPFFSTEAYTIETQRNGLALYEKECCDERGVQWNQAAVKGCIATKCVPYQNPHPCGSLPRYIVNGQYVPYEDVKRDHCLNSDWGQVATCCPPNSQASLIASAYGSELNEFPHMARLETEDVVCSGTVYNYNTVIVAANCVVDRHFNLKNPRTFRLILGVNIATSGSGGIRTGKNVYSVADVIVHPEFSWIFHSRRIYYDIALLRLERSIEFSQHIRALPLAPANFRPEEYSSHVVVVGWGSGDRGVTAQYLEKATLPIRNDRHCFRRLLGDQPYQNEEEFTRHLHCFGGYMNGEYSPVTGNGYLGGPAICRGPEGYAVLCGVSSLTGNAAKCRRNGDEASCQPSIYTDISYFRDWIRYSAGEQDWGTPMWKKLIFGDYRHWSEHPHQVKIISDQGPINCGGTLVSPDTVVTSGHCVFTISKGVRSGLKIVTSGGGVYWPRVGGLMIPSGFARYGTIRGLKSSSLQGHTWIDNLAIIKLAWKIPIDYGMIPSLPSEFFSVPPEVSELAFPIDRKKSEDFVVKRIFKTLSDDECTRRLEKLQRLGAVTTLSEVDKFMCGIEEYSGGGICDRLLGGGVICPGSGAGVLCGVQSFRFCDMSVPTPFLRVDKYVGDIIRMSML